MNIEEINRTLEWHSQIVLKLIDGEDFDLIIESNAGSGGPGENVSAFLAFEGVSFLSMPVVKQFNDCVKIELCSYESALKLTAIQKLDTYVRDEIQEGILKVIKFFDGNDEIECFVVCYGYEFWQEPENWNYDASRF